jgi:hypothetical protein
MIVTANQLHGSVYVRQAFQPDLICPLSLKQASKHL